MRKGPGSVYDKKESAVSAIMHLSKGLPSGICLIRTQNQKPFLHLLGTVHIVLETSMNIILENIRNLYFIPRTAVLIFKKDRSCICWRKSANDNDDTFIS